MKPRPILFADSGRLEILCHHSPPIDYPEDAHPTIQVCVPFENAIYTVNCVSRAKKLQTLGSKDILVIPAGQPHSVSWRRSADIASFQFSETFLAEAIGVPELSIPDAFSMRDDFASTAAKELRAATSEGELLPTIFAEAIGAIVARRVGLAARRQHDIGTVKVEHPLSPAQRRRVEAFINDNLDRTVSLAQLAAQERLSMWHFMRRFSASYGLSPHAFITRRRLVKAQELLRGSTFSVTEVALEIGFTHSHFSRTFFDAFGMTPSQFRRSVRE